MRETTLMPPNYYFTEGDLETTKACVTREVLEKHLQTTLITWMGGEMFEYTYKLDGEPWQTICYSPTNAEINEVYGKQLLPA